MILNIVLREIHQHVLSLRLHLVLVLLVVLFGLGTVSFINRYEADQERYRQIHSAQLEKEGEWAARYLGYYLVQTRSQVLEPRANAFITDAGEKMMPLQFWFTGFGVEGFEVPNWASNDMMQDLSHRYKVFYSNGFEKTKVRWDFFILLHLTLRYILYLWNISTVIERFNARLQIH